jgi:hypothetical protein
MGETFADTAGGKSSACMFCFQAKEARNVLTTMTAKGTNKKSDKQPLPWSCGDAAVCR